MVAFMPNHMLEEVNRVRIRPNRTGVGDKQFTNGLAYCFPAESKLPLNFIEIGDRRPLIAELLNRRAGVCSHVIDIASLPLPVDDAGEAIKDATVSGPTRFLRSADCGWPFWRDSRPSAWSTRWSSSS